ncbi:hypothetical protein I2492_05950 [Budviciaceae bacterium CWB-B4]|uniref:DUF2750 domain-containing protein n=1 Tax=Limnobaculum xujianqingii TaxID=2738837 RepID=A0A9D7AH28_9GAMM|nr:hypothetical protein [Limnobaculum xujianqingii]MBK5072551.1 hypothetical protein [Limnobaculum xujianqingii]MBK5175860.1 hypothetical protein [Limnobaculum xujianqingii]
MTELHSEMVRKEFEAWFIKEFELSPDFVFASFNTDTNEYVITENESEDLFIYAQIALMAWQASKQAIPTGWKLVPIEPTEQMLVSGLNEADPLGELINWDALRGDCTTRGQLAGIFKAMIQVAPEVE